MRAHTHKIMRRNKNQINSFDICSSSTVDANVVAQRSWATSDEKSFLRPINEFNDIIWIYFVVDPQWQPINAIKVLIAAD